MSQPGDAFCDRIGLRRIEKVVQLRVDRILPGEVLLGPEKQARRLPMAECSSALALDD